MLNMLICELLVRIYIMNSSQSADNIIIYKTYTNRFTDYKSGCNFVLQ